MTNSTTTERTASDQPATTEEPTLESICKQLEALTDRVEELDAEVERKDDRIEELEAELTEYKRFAGSEFADVRGRITDVEEQTEELEAVSQETISEGTDDDDRTTETPLERICTLPEHVADRKLTTNQQRARFIAQDVRDSAEKAPAGLVLDSQTIKKVDHCGRGNEAPHRRWLASWISSTNWGKRTSNR